MTRKPAADTSPSGLSGEERPAQAGAPCRLVATGGTSSRSARQTLCQATSGRQNMSRAIATPSLAALVTVLVTSLSSAAFTNEIVRLDVRGDLNSNGGLDYDDVTSLLGHLFHGRTLPACDVVADANGDRRVDVNDVMFMLNTITLISRCTLSRHRYAPVVAVSFAESQCGHKHALFKTNTIRQYTNPRYNIFCRIIMQQK